jgi:hypothetical protein
MFQSYNNCVIITIIISEAKTGQSSNFDALTPSNKFDSIDSKRSLLGPTEDMISSEFSRILNAKLS